MNKPIFWSAEQNNKVLPIEMTETQQVQKARLGKFPKPERAMRKSPPIWPANEILEWIEREYGERWPEMIVGLRVDYREIWPQPVADETALNEEPALQRSNSTTRKKSKQ